MKKLINKLVELWNYMKARNKIMSMRIDEVVDMKAKAIVIDRFEDIIKHIFNTTWERATRDEAMNMLIARSKGKLDELLEEVLGELKLSEKPIRNY